MALGIGELLVLATVAMPHLFEFDFKPGLAVRLWPPAAATHWPPFFRISDMEAETVAASLDSLTQHEGAVQFD